MTGLQTIDWNEIDGVSIDKDGKLCIAESNLTVGLFFCEIACGNTIYKIAETYKIQLSVLYSFLVSLAEELCS